MKKWSFLLIASFLVLISNGQEFSIIHDSLTRTYRLHLPVNYTPDSLFPLVINMHGLGSNAMEQEIYTSFNNVSDTGRFIVVYPNGIDEAWNVTSGNGIDDVGFISALIDTLALLYTIDLNRVYATGMSMGGFMSYRLACQLSDRIAAIASVAGLQAFNPCTPGRPVPVVQFHGTADQVVPYIGVSTTINNWVNNNGCPSAPVITELQDIDPNDNSTVTVSYYGLCDDSSEVILYTIVGGEHTWPGAVINIGITNQDIKASNEIWGFFRKYTLQGSTGLNDPINSDFFQPEVYPNPVLNDLTIELKTSKMSPYNIRIIDFSGLVRYDLNGIWKERIIINCTGIPCGLYMLEISNEQGRSYRKICIQ